MPRTSPYPELAEYHLLNQVTLKLNHVKKRIAVPYSHLGSLLQTYRLLASGTIPGACQVDKLEIDGAAVNLQSSCL
ncbi:hypothetical protein WJX77_005290 [Trebouxia sp. C0004]